MILPLLEKVKEINIQIETLAMQNDWEDVLIMSQERHQYIAHNLNGIEFADDIKSAKTLENLVSECDNNIRSIMKISKSKMISESLSLKHNFNAVNQYKNVTYA
ncbi:MAG: hypothetical protein COB38_01150 [Gammaproteobacteria bacterium]|nr:MAG: hypothetical protein COB38_01150 [Gammaproteobacteria bacterium]